MTVLQFTNQMKNDNGMTYDILAVTNFNKTDAEYYRKSWQKCYVALLQNTLTKEYVVATLLGISPNASGGLTPFSPPSELQEIPVVTREQSGVLCFHSRWMPVSPGASGMQPRDPFRLWRGTLASGHKPR